ncbi:oxidoreductase-like domain-containing protein [Burkholderia sp. Ac-20379]|uniref:oxidoreductase-like domain-containing protein n=1 Tax=Burkholderia sp. Ac-20379 TaxID=2703900 RepID=UPI00198131C4|nr:hypothetical protein [Burkholderia sp. Ac-20379]
MSNSPQHPASEASIPAADPRPEAPVPPELEDCCQSGCSPCIFDLYDDALANYKAALAQWLERHPEARPA